MTGLIGIFTWIVANWNLIVTGLSAIMSVSLFFMHGSAKADIQELQDFMNSIQLSQKSPQSAQEQARQLNPKI